MQNVDLTLWALLGTETSAFSYKSVAIMTLIPIPNEIITKKRRKNQVRGGGAV
jgi:hypothetical protein